MRSFSEEAGAPSQIRRNVLISVLKRLDLATREKGDPFNLSLNLYSQMSFIFNGLKKVP